MKRLSHSTQGAIAITLCLVAGFVDAIAYLKSNVFVANMTGNTVLIGIALAKHEWATGSLRIATVGVFFAGAAAGRMLLTLTAERQWVPLLIEAVAVALACIAAPGAWSWTLVLAAAMGMQATAVTQFGGVAVNTVVVTSAIARVAERVADLAVGRRHTEPSTSLLQARLQSFAWAAYGAGAAAAVWAVDLRTSLLLPAALLAALSFLLAGLSLPRFARILAKR